jgi:hypothetical protein
MIFAFAQQGFGLLTHGCYSPVSGLEGVRRPAGHEKMPHSITGGLASFLLSVLLFQETVP